jgi:mannose-6-phosphate isomerase-like protein (cupin superfamily)
MKDWLKPLSFLRDNLGKDGENFFNGMAHGTMTVEIYKPVGRDLQQPHAQDELYIVIAGTGIFSKAGEERSFAPGDLIFVEAGLEHRFETFTEDFETWVIFWGPQGGEKS